MAIEIVMPRLGWTMEEGVLAKWIKHDGDTIKPGDVLFTVESDKALQEVEAFDGGILRIPSDSPPVGSTIPVGGRLAYLVQPGEAMPHLPSAPLPNDAAALPFAQTAVLPANTGRSNQQPAISPRARRVAIQLGVDWTALKGSGRTGRIVERDVRAAKLQSAEYAEAAQSSTRQPDITPVARRAAEELGVDLGMLAGQLPGKRITREDVERASAAAPKAGEGETRQPVSRIRRLIADRMSHSSQTAALVTLTTEVDATELVALREHLKAAGREPVPSYNDLFVKLVAVALGEHPALNARLDGDEIVLLSAVHVGVAVDTERGLLVPVIRDAQAKPIRQIAVESTRLIAGARAGTLSTDQLSGGTFSITNLGMYEIDAFTPIINLPECAVLGIGRIVPKQVVIDAETERVAIRRMLFLSLTFDHRLVDGAPAARFLQRIKQLVEQPYLWVID
jgi:pyruvate dehydrogenase E2 component (dihydrolipoamide acetyltransferase)